MEGSGTGLNVAVISDIQTFIIFIYQVPTQLNSYWLGTILKVYYNTQTRKKKNCLFKTNWYKIDTFTDFGVLSLLPDKFMKIRSN